jgi:hypothetical protein
MVRRRLQDARNRLRRGCLIMIGLELYPGLGSRTYLVGDLEDCGLAASTFRKLRRKIFDFPGEIAGELI